MNLPEEPGLESKATRIKHFFTRHASIAPWTRRGLKVLNACARLNPWQARSSRVRSLQYLNVGCGKKPISHMINLNYEWYPFVDLTWDITKPLPLADSSLLGVYSEHVLEHLPFDSIPLILNDWKRVLKPGGTVRILVPDAEIYLSKYSASRSGERVRFPYHDDQQTDMMMVNRVFRNFEHLYAYDFETLARILDSSGFVNIQRVNHREGRDKNLLVDSEERAEESLRVEGMKP
jgi:predicted SAM-dependent methyltransferase